MRTNRTALGELVVLPLLRAAPASGRRRGRRRRCVRGALPPSLPRLLLVFRDLIGAHAVLWDLGGSAPSACRRGTASTSAVPVATSAIVLVARWRDRIDTFFLPFIFTLPVGPHLVLDLLLRPLLPPSFGAPGTFFPRSMPAKRARLCTVLLSLCVRPPFFSRVLRARRRIISSFSWGK